MLSHATIRFAMRWWCGSQCLTLANADDRGRARQCIVAGVFVNEVSDGITYKCLSVSNLHRR